MTPRLTVFHIFYSSTFTLLFLLLFALLLATPSDLIAQSRPKALSNIFTIAGGYILVLLLSLGIYISRVLSNRRSLASIPRKTPLDFPRRVKAVVEANILRSAEVAVQALPREDDVVHPGWDVPGGHLGGIEFVVVVNEMAGVLGADVRPGGTLRAWIEDRIGMARNAEEEAEMEHFLNLYERARFRRKGTGIPQEEFRGLVEGFEKVFLILERERRGGVGGGEGGGWYPPSVGTEDYTMTTIERPMTGETTGSIAGEVARSTSTGVPSSFAWPPPSSSLLRGYETDISRVHTGSIASEDTSSGGVRLESIGLKRRISIRDSSGTFG